MQYYLPSEEAEALHTASCMVCNDKLPTYPTEVLKHHDVGYISTV